jgi:diaminohydroxyphosphoribosylaminopyrimidine deaminase/5-amino-6-(5-phosphoribosylamino)uracil reductase
MASGESQWITGPAAREDVHRLRARSSAIMTGIGTVLADDPSLTARLAGHDGATLLQPLRVVIDSGLRLPPAARLLQQPGETLVVTALEDATGEAALVRPGVSVVTLPTRGARPDLAAVMQYLARLEVNELHLEAGARLSGAMLDAGLVDELVIYMAPHLMGDTARGLFHLPGLEKMAQRIRLQLRDIRAVGEDWRITAGVASQYEAE